MHFTLHKFGLNSQTPIFLNANHIIIQSNPSKSLPPIPIIIYFIDLPYMICDSFPSNYQANFLIIILCRVHQCHIVNSISNPKCLPIPLPTAIPQSPNARK
jgi:hypothetical protein